MRTATFLKTSTALLTILGVLALGESTFSQEIGTTAAVNQDTMGTPPNQSTRTLFVGTNVMSRERVQTSELGRTQLVFLDESSLNIGPGSDLILDEFVYDRGTDAGQLALTLGKGLMRYVGGKISKSGNVSVTTSHATIGVRGGIFDMIRGPYTMNGVSIGDETLAGHQFGVVTCRNGRTSEVIKKPDFICRATSAGIEVIPKPDWWDRTIQAFLDGRDPGGGPDAQEVADKMALTCGSGAGTTDPRCLPGLDEPPDPFIDQTIGIDEVIPEDLLENVEGGEGGDCEGPCESPDNL